MSCRLDLGNCRFVTLISVYAPTMSHPPEETENFYSDLGELVRKIPKDDKIALMGDFNARVGSDFSSWPVLGKHGIGKVNRNGPALLTFVQNIIYLFQAHFSNKKINIKQHGCI